MKKNVIRIVIALLCIVVILGGYYLYSTQSRDSVEDNVNLTETQKIITKNIDKDYPATPREVVKLYNRISVCMCNEDFTDDELKSLCDQMLKILDDELVEANPADQYYQSAKAEIEQNHENNKTIMSSSVCDSNDVQLRTIDGDECAYVTASYFINENKSYSRTYQTFTLRKDADGNWKILTWYRTEGESE